MKQYEAVISTLERLGGQATLAQLYQETMKVPGVLWGTKTPFASIRRIVQVRPEIFKVRPGLWALQSHRDRLGFSRQGQEGGDLAGSLERSHAFYQGLLTMVGNLRGFSTYLPNQDKNRLCLEKPLAQIRTLHELPPFSYEEITRRVATIDVSWFNERLMPHSLFEVEHSTDIQNSLLKFTDLQDFSARMVIVASPARRREFQTKVSRHAFREIAPRVSFYDYETLARDFEYEAVRTKADFSL